MAKILVVDDEQKIREVIRKYAEVIEIGRASCRERV